MFKGGVKEAARMLAGLEPSAQKKLLAEIKLKDPNMAAKLEENLVGLEDLEFVTPAMLVGLLRDVKLEDFGLALRSVEKSITNKILSMVSTGIKLDIEDGLNSGPKDISEIELAESKILSVMRKKIEQGQLVLSKDSDEWV